MITSFEQLIQSAKKQSTMKLAVAAAQDEEVLLAVDEAYRLGIAEPVLVGDGAAIRDIADRIKMDVTKFEIIDVPDVREAAREAVSLVSGGRAQFVMKGILGTADLLKAVLDKEIGLRGINLLSHVMVYKVPAYHKLIFLTDGGMNIAPSLEEKKQKYKKWRSKPMPFIKESSVETIRRRTVVDRKSGVAAEGILFNDAERWYNQDAIYCLYVAVESERAIPLLELVLRIIEQTGFGTDISTGAGQIEFLRQNGKILTRNLEMERIFDGSCGNMSINIASTVLIEDIFKGNEFLRYCIERYDSRNPQLVKPPYFYIPSGSLVKIKNTGPFIKEYTAGEEKAFIYSCVFPIRINRKGVQIYGSNSSIC